jgi:pimeloyl-ACP methyl ester carboxylesterase
MDPAIDPSDRPCPACYRGHPAQANRTPGIGRVNSLRTWLSMWSLSDSRCNGAEHLAKLALPALVVQSTGDSGVFPSDARAIHAAIASPDKQLELIPGAHYFEDSEPQRETMADLLAGWIAARG